MERPVFLVKLVLVVMIIYHHHYMHGLVSASVLSSLTHRHHSRQQQDKQQDKQKDIISEAVALLQDMFIDRHLYSQQDWDKLREDLRKSTNPVEGLKQLGTRLHDPYFRVISKESLTSDQIRTRGLAVSLQISLERRLSTQFLTHGLKRLFLPSSWLRLLTATPNYLALSASFWPLSKSGPRWLPALAGWSFLTYHLLPYIFPAQIVAHGPAGKSEGVKEGDVLLAVNRQGLPALTAAALQRWMDRGELGEVSLRVIRKNGDHWDEKEVKALRQLINESRVSFSSLPAQHGRGAGYLKINEFSTNCLDDCCEALHDLDQEIQKSHGCGLQALAIDLRDNRGGALSAALQLASLFTPHRAILQQVKVKDRIVTVRNTRHLSSPYERQGWIQEIRLQAHHWLTSCHLLPPPATTGLYNHIPLLILVNYQTASASEIFLEACLHSHPSSVLTVGSRTLGKNKAQALVSLSDGTGLCFSICEFLSPSGRSMAAGHLPQVFIEEGNVVLNRLLYDPNKHAWGARYRYHIVSFLTRYDTDIGIDREPPKPIRYGKIPATH
eukprot:scaffold2312_cov165-Ochromonas_danica.AAC.57